MKTNRLTKEQSPKGCSRFTKRNGRCGLPIEEWYQVTDRFEEHHHFLVGLCWKHRHSIPVCKKCGKADRNPEHVCKVKSIKQKVGSVE